MSIKNTILLGDCRLRLKDIPDNSIDSVVTDPPYELGFMCKSWDSSGVAYNISMWEEILRVLKPGAHLLSFSGTRTYHRMACAVEDAGFEIRDQMQWIYGSGFPKNRNISNDMITDNDKEFWAGWGTGPFKPANEPIVLARKPILEKTISENILKYGTGGLNIDKSRILYKKNDNTRIDKDYKHNSKFGFSKENNFKNNQEGEQSNLYNKQGRLAANILFDEEAANILDEQTGQTTSGIPSEGKSDSTKNTFGKYNKRSLVGHGDSGGASRFFYCAKASKKEKEQGLEYRQKRNVNDGRKTSIDNAYQRGDTQRLNIHPTVKPIVLMEYLIRLITPKNGIVLDPSAGSGTTLLAARNLGFNYIGIGMDPEYVDIANNRLKGTEGVLAFVEQEMQE